MCMNPDSYCEVCEDKEKCADYQNKWMNNLKFDFNNR